LKPGRSSEVLISQGQTQESTAAPTKKKKTLVAPTRKKSKKNPVTGPSESVRPTTVAAPAPSQSAQPRTIAPPSKSTHPETVEEETSRPVRKSTRIMNQVKGARTGGIVHID